VVAQAGEPVERDLVGLIDRRGGTGKDRRSGAGVGVEAIAHDQVGRGGACRDQERHGEQEPGREAHADRRAPTPRGPRRRAAHAFAV